MRNITGNLKRGLGIAALLWGSTVSVAAVQGCGPEKETIVERQFHDDDNPQGGNGSYSCEEVGDYVVECGSASPNEKNEFVEGCLEWNLPQEAPEWFDCLYSRCDQDMVKDCSYLIEQ